MDTIACEIATNEKMLDDNIGCIITKDMNNCKKFVLLTNIFLKICFMFIVCPFE